MKDFDPERLQQQMAFLREIDREKSVLRQTYLHDGSRKENDAEHAWHLALFVLILSEYANEDIDVSHTVAMVLIHDLIEIYAGDTYAYDEAARETQAEREREAADRLFALLPPDQGARLRALFEEFEARETPESQFAHTVDNMQPTMLNDASDGKSWVEHGIHLSQVLGRNERSREGSEILWDYMLNNFILPHAERGELKPD